MAEKEQLTTEPRHDTLAVFAIAAVVALVHLLTNNRYGFHRDELQVLSDALHLDWGFVPYPPLTPLVERIALNIFGVSMVGLRFFSVAAQVMAVVVTGFMARELGGGRLAQIAAALAVALSPLPLFEGTEFQYSTFDYLWWVGLSHEYAEKTLTSCRLAGHITNAYGVEYEESREHPDVFICGGPRLPWPDFWKAYQAFG